MKFETLYVGPEMAEQMLATSGFNRPVMASRVVTLANEMRLGKWQLNGETVVFAESGKLLDGQHRLHAIIESGCTVQLAIVRGAPESAFETIDTGRSRSGSDILAMNGVQNSAVCSSTAAMLWRMWHSKVLNEVCPPLIQLRVIERYPEIQKWSSFVSGGNRGSLRAILPPSAFLTALVYLDGIAQKPRSAEIFCEAIIKGENLEAGNPRLALRNRMLSLRAEGRIMNNTNCWAPTARTLTAIEAGDHINRLIVDKGFGIVSRPALWDEHIKALPPSRSLSDLYMTQDQSGRSMEVIKTRATTLRERAPA